MPNGTVKLNPVYKNLSIEAEDGRWFEIPRESSGQFDEGTDVVFDEWIRKDPPPGFNYARNVKLESKVVEGKPKATSVWGKALPASVRAPVSDHQKRLMKDQEKQRAAEAKEREKQRKNKIRGELKVALLEFVENHNNKTVCAMAGDDGEIVVLGYSTWKSSEGVSEKAVLDTVKGASTDFDHELGVHGTACAETHCLYQKKSQSLPRLAYSLAYDGVTKKFKKACPNCGPMLGRNKIIDLMFV